MKKKSSQKPWNQSTKTKKAKSKNTKLSANSKTKAKRAAKKAGRPYPNLVDNMNAAKKQRKQSKKSK